MPRRAKKRRTDGISTITTQGADAGTLESGEHEACACGGRQRFGCGGTLAGDEIAATGERGEKAVEDVRGRGRGSEVGTHSGSLSISSMTVSWAPS